MRKEVVEENLNKCQFLVMEVEVVGLKEEKRETECSSWERAELLDMLTYEKEEEGAIWEEGGKEELSSSEHSTQASFLAALKRLVQLFLS